MHKLRHRLFWLIDAVKGSPVKKHLEQMDQMFHLPFDELQKKNKPHLENLLKTAVSHTEFYQTCKGITSLEDFPVVNKNSIRQNFDKINLPESVSGKRFSVSTSGSTGTPFQIYQSQGKKIRNTADTLYFAKRSGFSVGYRLLYLRLWSAYYKKPKLLARLQNIDQLDVEEIDDAFLKDFFTQLVNDGQPKGWLGYPSGFLKICKFLDKHEYTPMACLMKSIITMSEPLDTYVRDTMAYYFNCPVVSRYSNVENGILAQQMIGKDNFTLNWASYHVELLRMDSDEPAKVGEPGRIVVTDLFNLATPMIRYDTGDVAVMQIGDNGFPEFVFVQGRIKDTLTNTKGEIVSPYIFYNNLYKYPELLQVQLVQKANKRYVFKLNCEDDVFEREKEFVGFFKEYLGEDAMVSTEYVDEIPLLKSGKRRLIVNETLAKVNAPLLHLDTI